MLDESIECSSLNKRRWAQLNYWIIRATTVNVSSVFFYSSTNIYQERGNDLHICMYQGLGSCHTYVWIYPTPLFTKLESVAPKNLSMDEIIDAGSSSYYEAKVALLAYYSYWMSRFHRNLIGLDRKLLRSVIQTCIISQTEDSADFGVWAPSTLPASPQKPSKHLAELSAPPPRRNNGKLKVISTNLVEPS